MKKSQGFTLIELMITVAIIGILASIAFPSYQSHVRKSARTDAYTALMKMADMQERYYLKNNTYAVAADIAEVGGTGTAEGYYTLNISAASASSFTINAVAVGPQANDTGCTTITLTSAGVKTPSGCW